MKSVRGLGASAGFSADLSLDTILPNIGALAATDYGGAYLLVADKNEHELDVLVEDIRVRSNSTRDHAAVKAVLLQQLGNPGGGLLRSGDYTVALVPASTVYPSLARGFWTCNVLAPKKGSASFVAGMVQQVYSHFIWPQIMAAADKTAAIVRGPVIIDTGRGGNSLVVDKPSDLQATLPPDKLPALPIIRMPVAPVEAEPAPAKAAPAKAPAKAAPAKAPARTTTTRPASAKPITGLPAWVLVAMVAAAVGGAWLLAGGMKK